MACSASLSKMILFIFNIVFFLLGVASLAVGIWVAVNQNELFRFINLVDGSVDRSSNKDQIDAVAQQNGLVAIAGFVLIGIGSFTLLVGFCGCCGAVKESKCLLGLYAFLVGLVLAVEVAAAIMAAVFQGRIRTAAEEGMWSLQDRFYVAMPDVVAKRAAGTNGTVTALINYVQLTFDCCGAKRPGDIANSSSWLASNRTWAGQVLQLPETCCSVMPQMKAAALMPGFDFNTTLADPGCPFAGLASASVNRKTCYSGILDLVSKYAGPLIGVSVGIAVFEFFCIVVACCLVRAIDHKD